MSDIVTTYLRIGQSAVRVDCIESFETKNGRVHVRTTTGAVHATDDAESLTQFQDRLLSALAIEIEFEVSDGSFTDPSEHVQHVQLTGPHREAMLMFQDLVDNPSRPWAGQTISTDVVQELHAAGLISVDADRVELTDAGRAWKP